MPCCQDFILSLEMIVFGILMNLAFSWIEAQSRPLLCNHALHIGVMEGCNGPKKFDDFQELQEMKSFGLAQIIAPQNHPVR